MRVRRAVSCAAVAIALGAPACGGDDDDDAGADRDGTTEATGGEADDRPGSDDRTESERDADEAAAESMLLTLADFPPGWQEDTADEDDGDDEDDELTPDLAECLGVDPAEIDPDNPSAESPSFTSANDQEVSVEVAFTPSADDAARVFEILADDATPGCYGEAVRTLFQENAAEEGLPEGVEMGDVAFERLPFAALGDESTAFRVTVPLSAEGVDVDLYLDLVLARVGRVGITGQFLSPGAPFDERLAADLVQSVVGRAPTEEAA